ncbi:MAG: polyribonucleotide nucleotidyltransferase [Anaerolineae bacterium CG_4_9_14_3_um_filter_57_17]|nr:polyribonucleotide nucleotidyltransferase [bacterium]NCT20540.1 polyribonucleotide nucleotidyltransferase [bacterium]OIO86343.1 MAG: polyribonucleotide nucleotidyltransferase [Anaerolineae bacterium CG2_30_57_67]PJB65732.1 MAG: polyribonucleotide nucleotidyltransferase [Anaerolineae bacterium CG_4_9_14_3_um_filter_57_17]
MKPEAKRYSAVVGTHTITFETGKLAAQAGGAVTIQLGDSIVFAAATMGGVRDGIDFFPLSVEYEERLYAGGKIPGSFFRREGRPSTEAILTARLTDRPLRPLFQHGMRNEVQVMMFSLSADGINPLDVLAINAASAAVMISDIPWGGPVGAVRIGRVNGEFVINPTFAEIEASDLDLRLAGTRNAILMVECGANEIPEDVMAAALELGHKSIQPIIDAQLKMTAEVGKAKREASFSNAADDLNQRVLARVSGPMNELLDKPLAKAEFYNGMDAIQTALIAEFCTSEQSAPVEKDVKTAFSEAEGAVVRERILSMGKRPDGRAVTEIRPIWCEVGLSPRAHGSGLFTRGETQVLTLATLGTLGEAQELDNLSPVDSKRYMHHYNFPPYCTGEVKPLRGQSRREIGHGALAERALEPVIPAEESFPYTLRLVSEVLASNGSSSMASVCGSTLALMDAGVPIKAPVAGVAMGLVTDATGRYKILTDIQGTEDHLGDMDFKVAGTAQGITALQMDIKISGLSTQMMKEALGQAHEARLFILGKMLEVLPQARAELKPHAPRIITVKIPVDKIGALIGPGGKNIRALQEETKVKIDVQEDGTVYIASTDGVGAEIARARVESLGETAEIGRIYTGKVMRVEAFGAFVQILPGMDGLVHISQLDSERVNKVEDICNVGDELTVMVVDVDPAGKIRLSRQAVLEGWTAEEAREHDRKPSGGGRPGGGGDRGGRGRDDRGGSGRGGFERRR